MFKRLQSLLSLFVAVPLVPPTVRAERVRQILSALGIVFACCFVLLLPQHVATLPSQMQVTPLWLSAQIARVVLLGGVSVWLARPRLWRAPSLRDQRVGQLITTLCGIGLLAFLGIMWLDADVPRFILPLVSYITMIVQTAQIWWLARHGMVRAAARLCLTVCLLIVVMLGDQPLAVQNGSLVLSYTALILIGGLLLRWWLGLVLAVALPVLHLVLQTVALAPGPAQTTWAVGIAVQLASVAGIVALYTRSLEHALRVADTRTAELAVHAEQLAAAEHALRRVVAQQDQRIADATAQLAYQAYHDPLTALPNRTQFITTLHTVLEQPQQPIAVLFLDLDGFKPINDRRGHAVGDALLVAVAQRLRACMRQGDLVARLGGDEFTVLLTHQVTQAVAEDVARRMVAALAAPIVIEGHHVMISASVGIVLHGGGPRRADDLISAADQAMYQAKHTGKGSYVVTTLPPTRDDLPPLAEAVARD